MTIDIVANRKLLTLCLALVILWLSSSLFPLAKISSVSASPDELKWSIVDTPSEEDNVVVTPSEISYFAIGSSEIFYAIDIPNGKVYKSIDGGITWEDDLTEALEDEGATLPAWDIAVAPDDPELVAVVTNNRTAVYVSEDGGITWDDIHVPDLSGLLISDIAISPKYTEAGGSRHDIAIGTRKPDGSNNGDIWIREFYGHGGWKDIGLDKDVTSVRFSPDYDTLKTIVAVASNTTGTYLYSRCKVDSTWEDWMPPVEIGETGEPSPKEIEIITSDLALPSNYSGRKASSRVVYVSYSSNTTADDVYRIEDEEVYRLDIKYGDEVPIASIAYHGTCSGGKLLAGEVQAEKSSASALIHICSNPEEYFPKWKKPTKPPSGGAVSGCANAQLAWIGGSIYCGTSTNYVENAVDWADMTLPGGPWRGEDFDESAFSISKDDGDTWNQLSLIDTKMSYLCDYALSADAKTLYLASRGSDFDSLWRSQSEILGETWKRILCLPHKGEDIILRPTPEGSPKEAIFLAIIDTDDARYSLDKGKTWERVWDCPDITDLAVVSNEMFYVLNDNEVNKCTWDEESWGGIWEWQWDIDTELHHGYSMAISGTNFVFVGEEDEGGEGRVAYSSDGGATFNLIAEAVPEPGDIHVIPDEEFASNRFIYAASGGCQIYRWAIGRSTSWEELNPGDCLRWHSLAQKGGALYAAYSSGVARTLIPHEEMVTPSDWDSLEVGLVESVAFKTGSLRAITDEAIDLWAIDGHGYDFGAKTGCLWVYSDTFALLTPWPTSPAIGELMPCDICFCQAEIFCFRWRELPSSEKYDVWIAIDERFISVITKAENITPDDIYSPAWCPPKDLRFVCGKTYYWKVRSCQSTEGEAIHSRWSPPMHFTVKTCSSVVHTHIAPILKVPENGSSDVSPSPGFSWIGFSDTTKYEFILSRDSDLTQIVVKEDVPTSAYQCSGKLDWGTTYFWQVKALEPVLSEPATGTFTVMPEPQPAPLITPAAAPTPFWVWLVIGILALLNIVIIVLCFVKR